MTKKNNIDYYNFGSEFIDDGLFGHKGFSRNPKTPWKNRDDSELIIEVSAKFIERFLDKRYIQEIRNRDNIYISQLYDDIAINGLREPLEIFIDLSNNLRFQDGHHRYIVCVEQLGYKTLPIILIESSGTIKAKGLNIRSFMPEMLRLVSIAVELDNHA